MQSKKNENTHGSSGSKVLKILKRAAISLLIFIALAITVTFIRGDSWSKWQARAAAKGQIDSFTERRGPDDAQTLTARRSLMWLLIHQKFPGAARREYNRYIADLQRLPAMSSFDIGNEKFLTACEFRSSGYLEIALEEFSAVEADEGNSYRGLNTSRFVIATLMEMKRFAQVEKKCKRILDDPGKLSRIREYDEWDPWAQLAMCFAAQGKHSDAESSFNRAIAVSAESRGIDDFRTHALRVQLARSLAAMGRNEEAIALARKALPVFESYKYSSYESLRKLREFIAGLE